ncbi:MAG: TIGR04283 family arsenosugar biosynthesis glycosyltransferase [Nitrospinae bacterium]|nr:TIGR04283 family arsenosugar biosynthesis glycosyltransferase [Nitrospinota bacterium]MBF0633748.1 TIGR04283 family arsenosugar biosynthesis glycosyltransferase [Nitrospinota bacterium]
MTKEALLKSRVSIIVPTLREGGNPARLARLFNGSDDVELVFALAQGDGATQVPTGAHIKTVTALKGRARQMNAGASAVTGDILLFLHADTRIAPESLDNARMALSKPGVVGGAYRLRIASPRRSLKIISTLANLRSRWLGMPYGDQAIFVKRELFKSVGGYEDIPIMEDVRLIEALRKKGQVVMIEDYAETSPRRWEKEGVLKATMRNIALATLFKLGVNPERLAKWYGA